MFILEILCFLIENYKNFMKNAPGKTLGAPKLREMVPRGSGRAQNGCPEVPRRAQGGKKGDQETHKNAPGTPT